MTGRVLRGAVAAVVLLAVLAGLPVVLVTVARLVEWDWPMIVAQPLSPGGVLAAALAVGGLVWLSLVRAVALDVVDAVRRVGRAPRLPVPLHTAVTALAGGVVLAVDAMRGGTGGAQGPLGSVVGPDPGVTVATVTPVAGPVTGSDVPAPGSAPGAPDDLPAAAQTAAMGVQLPGGWLPLPVAGAVTAAVALLWIHRRRRYQPRPPAGWRRDDPDLTPLPPSLDKLTRLTRRAANITAGSAADTADLALDLAGELTGAPADEPADVTTEPPAAPDDPDDGAGGPAAISWHVGAVLPPPGVRLVGPGAADAARGLLVAMTARPGRHGPLIVVTAETLDTLLGPDAAGRGTPRLQVAADPGAALGTPAVLPSRDGAAAGAPAVVLFTSAPTPAPHAGLETSAGRVVWLGAAPHGAATWHVAEDGTTRRVAGPASRHHRLPVLDRAVTHDLLTSLGLLADGSVSAARREWPAPLTGRSSGPTDGPPFGDSAVPDVDGRWPDLPPPDARWPRRLLVRVLGQPVVLLPRPDGSHSPVSVRRSAGRQVLVLLAVHRDGMNGAALKQAVWPDVPSDAAHRRFITTMSELRRALHAAASRPVLQEPDRATTTGPARYRLDPDAVQVDLWRLRDLLDAAAATADPQRRYSLLQAAAAVPGGNLAEGWDHEWIAADRERVARHLLDLRIHLADLEPEHSAAVQWLRTALRDAPANEAVHRRLLYRHAAAGDTDGLRRAVATMNVDLTAVHAEPEPETVQLAAELLADLTGTADTRSAAGTVGAVRPAGAAGAAGHSDGVPPPAERSQP